MVNQQVLVSPLALVPTPAIITAFGKRTVILVLAQPQKNLAPQKQCQVAPCLQSNMVILHNGWRVPMAIVVPVNIHATTALGLGMAVAVVHLVKGEKCQIVHYLQPVMVNQ